MGDPFFRLEAIKKMIVSVELDWSILPQNIVDTELAVLELKGLKVRRALGVVQHSERTLADAAQAMLDTVQESAYRRRQLNEAE